MLSVFRVVFGGTLIETPFLLVLFLRRVVMSIRPLELLDPDRAPLGFCCGHV